jgi:hypothetical protein
VADDADDLVLLDLDVDGAEREPLVVSQCG